MRKRTNPLGDARSRRRRTALRYCRLLVLCLCAVTAALPFPRGVAAAGTGPSGTNTLSLGSGSGASGSQVTVPLSLSNEDVVKGLQTDVLFDPAVVSYLSGSATGRGAAMSFSAAVVSAGKLRVILYYQDASTLGAGSGALANLTFSLVGTGGMQTALTPSASVLSDPSGAALSVTHQAGAITINAVGQAPTVTVTVPNGGETLRPGVVRQITYSATDPDTPAATLQMSFHYSTNSGASWIPIVSGQSNTGSYLWTVPAVNTTHARVRVTASDGTNEGSDASNADFTIAPSTGDNVLSVGSGSGEGGSQVTVSVDLSNEDVVHSVESLIHFDPSVVAFLGGATTGRGVGMDFSADVFDGEYVSLLLAMPGTSTLAPGAGPLANLTFSLIGADGASSELTPTETVLSDPDGQPLNIAVVAGEIAIAAVTLPPTVTVTFPNGGETLHPGPTASITYTATDPDTPGGSLLLSFDYSTNSGANWIAIASGRPNSGSFAWSVPQVSTTHARVRATVTDGTSNASDASNADFTIAVTNQPPTVTLTAPNGGETLSAGSPAAVTYTATDPDTPNGSLLLGFEYSTDSGVQWLHVASGRTNTGSYLWTVPQVSTTHARVRATVTDGTSEASDASNADFTIVRPPGNNVLSVGSGSGEGGSEVGISLNLSNEDIVKGLQTDVEFDPAIVAYAGGDATGRGTGMDFSAAVVGDGVVRVVLFYSDQSTLSPGTGALATLIFTLSGAGGSQSALTPSQTILSDPSGGALNVTNQSGAITITVSHLPPVVALTAPNGGETLRPGSTTSILYAASDPDTPSANLVVSFDYSTNGGGNWTSIASGRPNTGSYAWTVPEANTTHARVRATVSDGTSEASDASNADFTIARPPGNNVLSIGSGSGASGSQVSVPLNLSNEDIVKGLQTDVEFDPAIVAYAGGVATGRGAGMDFSAAVVGDGTLRVVLFYSDPSTLGPGSGAMASLTFSLIGAGGSQSALTPSQSILSDPSGAFLNVSNQAGAITVNAANLPPTVALSSPNGGETVRPGTTVAIGYAASDPDTPGANLRLSFDYSTDSGASWLAIAAAQPNTGSYSWSVPEVSTTHARVRVTVSDGAHQVSDVSDADFAIAIPSGNNSLSIGSAFGNAGSQVEIELSLSNEDAAGELGGGIEFNPAIVSYIQATTTGRGTGMTLTASVTGGNTIAYTLTSADPAGLAPGAGPLALFRFSLGGSPGSQTALSPVNTTLFDPAGLPLAVSTDSGSISILQPPPPARIDLTVLRNPGRIRCLQIFVVSDADLTSLSVAVSGTNVQMVEIDPGRNIYSGGVQLPNGVASAAVSADGTGASGVSHAETTVTF